MLSLVKVCEIFGKLIGGETEREEGIETEWQDEAEGCLVIVETSRSGSDVEWGRRPGGWG